MNETSAAGLRRRLVTWSDPAATAAAARRMAGLDFLRALERGELAPPPVIALLGITLAGVEHGCVRMRLTPGEHHYNPIGSVHGGVLATLLDSVLGCAVHSALPLGRAYTTLEVKVNYLRAVTEATGEITAEGRTVHVGRRSAVAEARATDRDGRMLATASTTCIVLDLNEAGAPQ